MMKQALISMRSRQGEGLDQFGTDNFATRISGTAKSQQVGATGEEKSSNKPKPTVFVSVGYTL